jgi:hypothetical protein
LEQPGAACGVQQLPTPVVEPQTPPLQALEQHCEALVQLCPSALHVVVQTPPLQALEQHCEPVVQLWPLALHALQSPPLQLPEQHWLPLVQLWPLGVQVVPPQTPPEQKAEQHWPLLAQLRPSDLQAPHVPALHAPVQHCEAEVQLWPSGLHELPPQTPPLHVWPLQHSVLSVHAWPAATHAAQTPALQMLEQQSLASVHEAPSSLQAPHLSW